MPSSPRSPDAAGAAAGLRARLEAAERLIGELREGMAVMAGTHRRELEARDVVIAGQAETIAGQADRIAQLERRLGRDSSSSSKPPSSDSPFTKGSRNRSLREKTGRRPGKQPGAPGRTLRLSDDPDKIIGCAPAECGRCGRDLAGEPAVRTERRQRWDIAPPPPPYITEYRKITKVCPCCQAASAGQVPADVTSPGGVRPGDPGTRGEPGQRASRAGIAGRAAAAPDGGDKGLHRVDGRRARPGRRRAGAVHGTRPGPAAHRPGAER
jgi:Family of unknown function (DUF6444)